MLKTKKIIACIIALMSFVSTTAFAREIKGCISDAKSGEPIPYASVSVHSLPDSTIVDFTITTDDGAFELKKVGDEGTFFIRISSVGYVAEQRLLSEFASLSDISIALQPDRILLDEIVVEGRKKLISLTPQGVSYDMAHDSKCQVDDLLTALRRVPMLTVDGLGKLMVKGGSNYSIYLNGKPFRSANLDPTQVLSSIPAANVLRIEIITNPDASYEAESGSTVVNIVTQGRKILGQSVMMSMRGETQPKGSGAVGYNLVTPRLKLSLAYDYNLNKHRKQPVEISREVKLPTQTSTLESHGQNDGTFQYHTGRLMLEAEIDSLNILYADGHLRFTSTDYNLNWQKQYMEKLISEDVLIKNKSKYKDGSAEANLFYKNLRKDKQERFSAGYRFAYSPDVRSQEGVVSSNNFSNFSKNTSDGGLWEHTLQLDATPVRNSGFTLKTGAVGAIRYGRSNPLYYTKSQEQEDWQEISDSSDKHTLRQYYNNIAAYINANYHCRRFSLSAGARLEHAHNKIKRRNNQVKTEESHLNFIPRLSMSYQPGAASQISLSYYCGVQRPSIWLLNPFVDKIDDYNSTMGNPDLKPQKTHSFGLNYLLIAQKLFAQFSIDYAITRKPIFKERWLEQDNVRLLYESYYNGAKYQSIIPSLMLNYRPTPRISINTFGNVGGLFFYGDNGRLMQKNLIYNIQTNMDVNLPDDFYIGGKYGYTHSSPVPGSKNKHSHLYSFYLTKRMMEGKLSLSLTANRPFQKYNEFRAKDWGECFEQHRSNWITARSFGFKMVYKFGIGDRGYVKRNNRLSTRDLDRSTGVK